MLETGATRRSDWGLSSSLSCGGRGLNPIASSARLFPPVKPRFSSLKIVCTQGKRLGNREGVASSLALSSTTTWRVASLLGPKRRTGVEEWEVLSRSFLSGRPSSIGMLCCSIEVRQARRWSQTFQEMITITRSVGGGLLSVCGRSLPPCRALKRARSARPLSR